MPLPANDAAVGDEGVASLRELRVDCRRLGFTLSLATAVKLALRLPLIKLSGPVKAVEGGGRASTGNRQHSASEEPTRIQHPI